MPETPTTYQTDAATENRPIEDLLNQQAISDGLEVARLYQACQTALD
jgi:hypothetical protein